MNFFHLILLKNYNTILFLIWKGQVSDDQNLIPIILCRNQFMNSQKKDTS